MRIIFNGFQDKENIAVIYKIADHFKVDYCHIIYDRYKADLPPHTEAVFHYWDNLNWTADYKTDWNRIRPLDEELIEKMRDCEAVFLKMADRLETKKRYSYDERKSLYFKHLRYWNHVIEDNKIDLFLSSNIPHETFDYVIYCLCRLKGIPSIMLYQSQINDTLLIMDDWENSTAEIKNAFADFTEKYGGLPDDKIILSGRFKKEYEKYIHNIDPMPFYMAKTGLVSEFLKWIRSVLLKIRENSLFIFNAERIFRFVKHLRENVIRSLNDRLLFNYYENNAGEPDLKKKYLYFPLHYQPELTTCPIAGAFVDQILIAQMIAYLLPKDVYLYIKEHPKQTSVGRNKRFYRDMLELPRVKLISRAYDSFSLIDNCAAVITASGTAGWEALFKRKPVIMFGHNFYQYAKGVFPVKTIDDLKITMDAILIKGLKPELKDIKIFLKSLEAVTIEGYIDKYYQAVSEVGYDDNIKNISEAIISRIKKNLKNA